MRVLKPSVRRTQIQKLQRRSKLLAAACGLEWFDRRTAAAYAGLSTGTLDKLIKQGSIPSTRIQARVCIKRALLDAYLMACTTGRSNVTL